MTPIGGYFGLELNPGTGEYHKDTISLNTGRNAFEYVLRATNPSKIFVPFYQCEVLMEPIHKLRIPFEYYFVTEGLSPKITTLSSSEKLLYINYFGVKTDVAISLSEKYGEQVILDSTQSFFSLPLNVAGTFYSARKFFGVADGAYLYSKFKLDEEFEQDHSFDRYQHLLKRIDLGAEEGYKDFQVNDKSLSNQPIRKMSNLSKKVLEGIDYKFVEKTRKENFTFLHNFFSPINELQFQINDQDVPLCYPLLLKNGRYLKKKFIENKVFVPTYWNSVKELVKPDSFENHLVDNMVCLPIDQRYDQSDMSRLIKLFESFG